MLIKYLLIGIGFAIGCCMFDSIREKIQEFFIGRVLWLWKWTDCILKMNPDTVKRYCEKKHVTPWWAKQTKN